MRWLNSKDNPINDDDDDKLYLIKNEYGNLFFANRKHGVWISKTKEPIASPEEGPIDGKFVTGYVPINTDMLISNDVGEKIAKYRKKAKRYQNWLVEEQLKHEKVFNLLQEYHRDLYLSGNIERASAVAICISILEAGGIDTEEEEDDGK